MVTLVNDQTWMRRWYNVVSYYLGEAQAYVKEKSGQERYNAKITAVWSEEMGEGLKQMTEALTGLCVIMEGGEKDMSEKSSFFRSWYIPFFVHILLLSQTYHFTKE